MPAGRSGLSEYLPCLTCWDYTRSMVSGGDRASARPQAKRDTIARIATKQKENHWQDIPVPEGRSCNASRYGEFARSARRHGEYAD